MTSPRVFIVNAPRRRNRETGVFEPIYDLTPARDYGELVMIFPDPNPTPSTASFAAIRAALEDFGPDDMFMVGIGHPVLLAWAIIVLAIATGGAFKTISWAGSLGRYVEDVRIDLEADPLIWRAGKFARRRGTLKDFVASINALAQAEGATDEGVPYCPDEEWADAFADGLSPEEAWANEKAAQGDGV